MKVEKQKLKAKGKIKRVYYMIELLNLLDILVLPAKYHKLRESGGYTYTVAFKGLIKKRFLYSL